MSDLMDAFWRAPPLSRTLAAAIFVTSVGAYMGFLPGSWFYFQYQVLFRMPPQIWRLAANFLITQPKLAIILDPYFTYSYLSQLETGHPRFSRKEDLLWYLIVVCSTIMAVDNAMGFNSGFYLQGLILALAYTGTQDQRGLKTNFFFVTIPAQLVPYAMILVTLLMAGPAMFKLQLCGLFAAHLYDFLTRIWPEFGGGSNWLATPAFLSRLVSSAERAIERRSYGTAIRGTGVGSASGTGAQPAGGSGPLPDAWRTRGKGQRLGGD